MNDTFKLTENQVREIINCLSVGTVFYLNGDKYYIDVERDEKLEYITRVVYYDIYLRKTVDIDELSYNKDDNIVFIIGYAGTKFQIS